MRTPSPASHPHHGLGIGKGHTRYPRAPQINVTVTTKHIAEAKARDSSHCMTSAAIMDARPDAFKIAVDLQTIRFSDKKRRLRYVWLTPRIVQEAIVLWDQGQSVEPFSFQLRGAHVTTMYQKKEELAGIRTEPDGSGQTPVSIPITKATESRRANVAKANLARQGLRMDEGANKTGTPARVGGRRPPISRDKNNVPFSRRRAFGLRALVR